MSWGEALFLKKIIQGQRTLVASDNLYARLHKDDWSSIKKGSTVELAKMNWKGSLRLKVKATADGPVRVQFASVKDGVETDASSTFQVGGEGSSIYGDDFSRDVNFNRGDTIVLRVLTGYGYGTSISLIDSSVSIYADVIDGSAVTIL